jgi:hypothetical protein
MRIRLFLIVAACGMVRSGFADELPLPHPVNQPTSPVMLRGDWVPADPHRIDFHRLPYLPSQRTVVSDVRATKTPQPGLDKQRGGVNQHNYLVHHDGRFWVMWSDGPGIEDRVGQRVKFATSADGAIWSEPRFLTPSPPDSGPDSPHYGTRTNQGLRWISRGFWPRDGELYALASLDEAAGFFGPSLALHAFRLTSGGDWEDMGVIVDNAINNFPPKPLPGGEWMMSRRTHDYKTTGVQFLVGGVERIDQWQSFPVLGSNSELAAEEPLWWTLPEGQLVSLFRDNRRSGFLYRAFSTDQGRTWSRPVCTNFPDATSKLHGLRLSDGRYVLVSNANPKKRDPLTLALSEDGLVFDRLGVLVGGRHVDYPHVIEHDGQLLVAFAGGKQTVEVLTLPVSALGDLRMPPSVELTDAVEPARQLRVSTDFEGGSARVLGIDQAARLVRFMPGGDPERGWPCWWFLRLDGVGEGEQVSLELLRSDLSARNNGKDTGKPLATNWAMPARATYSTDGTTWQHTVPGERTGGRIRYAVTGTGGPVWMAWGPPFTPKDTDELIVAAQRTLPAVQPFELARTRGGLPVRGLHVPKEGNTAPAIWVQARQHAWESGASWVARGFTEWLTSDDEDARWLRSRAEIFVVPIMDVDNVATGNGGKEADPRDHNRDWAQEPVYPEVAAAQQRLRALAAAGRLELFLDLHNPAPGDARPFFFLGPPELLSEPAREGREFFLTAARTQIAGPLPLEEQPRITGPGYHPLWQQISGQWVNAHGSPQTVAACLETAWNTPHSTTDGYRTVGRQLGLAATDLLRHRLGEVR